MSANFAVAVINRSLTTMNSHLCSSRRISAVRLTFPCWLMRQLPAMFRIILIPPSSRSAPFTPSSAVSSAPRSTASVHRKDGIFRPYGFGSEGKRGHGCRVQSAAPQAQPPHTPTLPVMQESRMPPRALCSP